jgi:hypothetical protein
MAEKAPPQDGAILQVPISIIGGAETLVTEPLSRVASEAPYTGYSSGEQIMIVVLGSIVALLSPFTANIYVRSGGSLLFLSNI